MKNLKRKLTLTSLLVSVLAFSASAQPGHETNAVVAVAAVAVEAADAPDAANLRTFIELTRTDLKTQKAVIIAENLPLLEAEAIEFWPLHREYEAELSKLNDQKLAWIVRYADLYNAGTMTDKAATELAKASFDLEEDKTDLKRKYFKKFSKVMPAMKSARFFQIENQINAALDLRVAASVPLIK